jgi:NAD(P)H-dependent FMN reductase
MTRILLLNGSLRGATGNTHRLLEEARRCAPLAIEVDELELATCPLSIEAVVERVRAADALLFGSGVYWGSWGSPVQRFLEVMTSYELTDVFLGKPAAVVLSMDSVGGSDAGQRLLGVLSNLGALIPPCSMVVVSRVAAAAALDPRNEDVWQLDDVGVLVENLLAATAVPRPLWRPWSITRTVELSGPYPAPGLIDLAVERFLEPETAVPLLP